MKMNSPIYVVQTAHGAQADTAAARWLSANYNSTLNQARAALADIFAAKHDGEDRGEDYEREWLRLIEQSKTAEVGDVLCFDEFAARIVVED